MNLAVVWLLQFAAAVMWGTMYVPVRKCETYDGIVFQWYMCSGALFTAICIHILLKPTVPPGSTDYTHFPIYNEGLIGGSLWALANIFVVPSVKFLGLGVGFTLYHSVNLVMGYLNGKYGLYGLPVERTTVEMDASMLFFLASFILIVLVESTLHDRTPSRSVLHSPLLSRFSGEDNTGEDPLNTEPGQDPLNTQSGEDPLTTRHIEDPLTTRHIDDPNATSLCHWRDKSCVRRVCGILCGLFAGYCTSVNMVPFAMWVARNNGKHLSVVHFTLSQCLGIFLTSTAYMIIGNGVRRLWPGHEWPRQPVIFPAMTCGVWWAIGFLCATVGVSELGMSVGYVMTAVGPVGISAFCAHFIFKEIQGDANQIKFWSAIGLQAIGVCLVACFRP